MAMRPVNLLYASDASRTSEACLEYGLDRWVWELYHPASVTTCMLRGVIFYIRFRTCTAATYS